ncbi:hypothetical protein CR194_07040 [Salipaludibacillus keqinensis]|uniref:Uncharacterized protein n=1 Tax=Salipaludibacillus keqinensis TaxID=2045207 RepID=A0A323TKX1_9BACI|nr:hypothetical protein [Salipaludibacillus keqinensis]PYZ95260.1 hypothetical protein CR194_07040 [Salipaludibacillus keqinensis]
MAFGVSKHELSLWKKQASEGNISFLTHFWYDARFPQYKTVTKAACSNRETLVSWGKNHGLKESWIHDRDPFPHFDLIGETEKVILKKEGCEEKLIRLEEKLNSNYTR